MGHSEMLLAVAGMSESQIAERTDKLASGDWSAFTPAEQLVFRFAHRITRDPASLTDGDVAEMRKAFGPHRTADLIWYGGWCNYMTRVADTFQFPLERENCFMPTKAPQTK